MSMSKFENLNDEARRTLTSWYREQKYTDVKLILRDKKNKRIEIRCHKIIMATRSAPLERLLYGRTWGYASRHIFNDKFEDFEPFLEYLYTNVMKSEGLVGILTCAIKYKVTLCPEDFDVALSARNMMSLYLLLRSMMSSEPDAKVFMKILKRKMGVQALDVLIPVTNEFRTMSVENLHHLLGFVNLNIPLEYLVQAIQDWAECQCINNGLELNSANKRRVLGVRLDSLPSVQSAVRQSSAVAFLKYMSTGYFEDFISRSEFLRLGLDLHDLQFLDEISRYLEREMRLNDDRQVAQEKKIYVVIKFPQKRTKFMVELVPSSSVEDLKSLIFEKVGVPTHKQDLQYEGRSMRFNFIMRKYNVQTGDYIRLHQRK